MTDKGNRKLRLLYIKEYLERKSDEETPVDADEISEMLKENGITCERKSIYSDVQALKDYGLDVASVRAPKVGYAVFSRDFELPELRLLIDAVQAANFITPKKTRDLIEKIGTLCSEKQRKFLKEQVSVENRVKCTNEEIYYNIDILNRAIQQKRKVSFTYQKRKINDESGIIETEEKAFTVSPYALIWNSDHYYLVSNNEKYSNLMHTRIDRMKRVMITFKESRHFSEVSPYKTYFDSADYSSKIFNMFSGEAQKIEIECHSSIIEEIIDRFGKSAEIRKSDNKGNFKVITESAVSDGLVSWIMQFSDKVEVISPKSLKEDVKRRAESILQKYC